MSKSERGSRRRAAEGSWYFLSGAFIAGLLPDNELGVGIAAFISGAIAMLWIWDWVASDE